MRFSLRALFIFTTGLCILGAIGGVYFRNGVEAFVIFCAMLTISSPFICLAVYPFASSYDYSHEAKAISAVLLVMSGSVLVSPLIGLGGLACVGFYFNFTLAIVQLAALADDRRDTVVEEKLRKASIDPSAPSGRMASSSRAVFGGNPFAGSPFGDGSSTPLQRSLDMAESSGGQIDTVMQERRLFPPGREFSERARIKSMAEYEALWKEAEADPEMFWAREAAELHWFEPFDQVLQWNEPFAQWFIGGKTNASYNCLDAHLSTERRDKIALDWEGEPGDRRTLTYAELHREVCRAANMLKDLGIEQGDVVSIYMPMVPELAIAMLACARIGAVHSVIFAGFSSEAIADRNHDASAKLQITADAAWRRGKELPLKETVDEALAKSPTVEKCLVLRRTGCEVAMQEGRDFWWHELMERASDDCPAMPLDSETPLFILYTSGSTGKPKGIKHTTAGYNLFAKKTFEWVFDHRDDDVFWCTADCGWITGHSYVVYGPLSAGATCVMYEGAPNHPAEDRFWQIVEEHKVTVFYTAPTAIRAFIKWGDAHVDRHDLSSLRLLGTVGEGINPEAWMWYHTKIGGERCPIVDTWWQTETGGIMMSPLPGATPTKPGSCTKPLPGVVPAIIGAEGQPVETNQGGMLMIAQPWPGMLRGIWGDDERYREQYWATVPGMYLTGDNARCDDDGYYWIMGRIDDVLNVSGHRLSTIEIESALVSHPAVAEAAAVGRPHELKGEAVAVFVTLREGDANDALRDELKKHVRHEIGALAQPDDVRFTTSLPKTRSGKIMRRLLRDIASGKETVGDTTTLEDYSVLAKLRDDDE